ncbi:proton-conducting membrane transporter [Hujiaoplasma nucleasis]|uniref:Proton-conducting membrane transporter n=1 Tax=Hujiaoplasma nucleasis TaxID=2725268 RepID=A0A7L6N1S8_9MOLU|nr:proton-conducting transporter membrane subunit [Hujiaoplasma nucleasis]QLY40220.1 proton-conducting membrane transporter [Hujiaoplasma nucleasis]
MKRKIKILDKMVKSNSILVGLSLLVLIFFIAFLSNWFSFQNFLVESRFYQEYLNFLNKQSLDIFVIILIPVIGATFDLIFRDKNVDGRDKALIYMGFFVIVFMILIYPKVLMGTIDYQYKDVLLLGISFHIDMLSYTVLLISSFVWFYVIVYAHEYMKHELHSTRFFFFLALTYSSVLGTMMSGDLLTMFLFFEIMTIASYTLVIHGQNDESYKAGYNYIIMGLIGGFLILTAILLLYFNLGDLSFESAISELSQMGSIKYWIIGLIIFGFGIKAGMAPVHVWLPRAHPVAPTPASALLSGVMIKVGAFGIIRVVTSYYFPDSSSIDHSLWLTSKNIGYVIIWSGIITMVMGMILALQQANIKKLLAYSSISQMGYILMGIGIGLYLGYEGAMGYTGAIYHIINHALFKSLLFMVAGVVYYHTHELNMYKLGGIWKKLPVTTIIFVIGMLGVIGMPLFNGYISKTILHHGIVEAYQHGSQIFILAEILFIITSIGTVAYLVKMFYYVFIKDNQKEYKDLTFDFSSLDLALISMSLIIILIGLNPNFILKQFILPQLNNLAYSSHFIETYIQPLNVFKFYDIIMALMIIFVGSVAFLIGKKFSLLSLHFPKWLSIEYLFFYPAYLLMKNLCKIIYGHKCPYNEEEFIKLSDDDLNNVGFIDRFVITVNVLNRRYEQSLIYADAFIYVFVLSGVFIYFFFYYIL